MKGHYKGKQQLCHELNHLADKLATDFNSINRQIITSPPILPPNYEAESHHLSYIKGDNCHYAYDKLHLYIKRLANWPEGIDNKVDWVAHQQAYESYQRPQRISISKISPWLIPHE